MINLTQELVCEPHKWYNVLLERNGTLNLETTQSVMWNAMNLPIQPFPRTMFTVKTLEDPTRWSNGSRHDDFTPLGLLVKYPDELAAAKETCHLENMNMTDHILNLVE